MTPQDEITVLKADRENLHRRVQELLANNEKLRDQLKLGELKVVIIGDNGHYVNEAVKAEIESLRVQLATEKEITENLTWAVEQSRPKS